MPRDALFSHRTAAWLHGLDLPPCDPIEITLPAVSTTSHLAGVSLTRSDYDDSEVSWVRELPATSPTRTIADLARRGPLVEAVVILDMALRAGLIDLEGIGRWPLTHRRHRGLGWLERAIRLADGASESPMETRLRVLLVAGGLPRPRVQVSLHDESGCFIVRPDLLFTDERLALEYDGATHRASVADDNRRQNRLIEAGYRVLRFTAADVLHRPAAVVGQVRRALDYSIGSPN